MIHSAARDCQTTRSCHPISKVQRIPVHVLRLHPHLVRYGRCHVDFAYGGKGLDDFLGVPRHPVGHCPVDQRLLLLPLHCAGSHFQCQQLAVHL